MEIGEQLTNVRSKIVIDINERVFYTVYCQ